MELIGTVHLLAGDASSLPGVLNLLGENGIEAKGNPDLYIREYSSFGVEEARDLSARSAARALAGERRVFVIVAAGMTTEAQNALLKTLEEPSGGALFFIIVPAPQTLLPTLRSRAQLLQLETKDVEPAVDPAAFLKARPQMRLDMLKPLLDKDEDEKRDLAGTIRFLSALERALLHDPMSHAAGLEAVYRARKYLGDKGALSKALLEQVALVI